MRAKLNVGAAIEIQDEALAHPERTATWRAKGVTISQARYWRLLRLQSLRDERLTSHTSWRGVWWGPRFYFSLPFPYRATICTTRHCILHRNIAVRLSWVCRWDAVLLSIQSRLQWTEEAYCKVSQLPGLGQLKLAFQYPFHAFDAWLTSKLTEGMRERTWLPIAHYCTPSLQGQLYDTLRLRHIRPDLLNFQPRRTYHLMPLPLRALGRCQTGHHSYINLSCDKATFLVGENELIEEDFGVAWRHCWRELGEDELAMVIRPVMEDIAEIVSTCA